MQGTIPRIQYIKKAPNGRKDAQGNDLLNSIPVDKKEIRVSFPHPPLNIATCVLNVQVLVHAARMYQHAILNA